MNTSSTRSTPLPAAMMPSELMASSVWEMEPGERKFISCYGIFTDLAGRVWVNAEATIVNYQDETFTAEIRRTEMGVELWIPSGWKFTRQLEMRFEKVLPATRIEVMALD